MLIAAALVAFYSCGSNQQANNNNSYTESNDSILYAKGFTLAHISADTISINVFNPWQGAKNVQQSYRLVSKENFTSKADLSSIPIPIERAVCMSSSYVAFFNAIGCANIVNGISGVNYIYDHKIAERIDSGLVKEVGYEQTLNYELIASLRPDVVLCYGVSEESMSNLQKLNDLGIRVMIIGEYLENHPLGKAEWIKVFGALCGREHEADSIFNSIKTNYIDAAKKTTSCSYKPTVFLNLPFKDVWYTPGNDNYFIQLIRDAGGDYMFKDLAESRSYPISFERAFEVGLQADVWLNPGSASSLYEIGNFDPRLMQLKPIKNGMVFNNNHRLTPHGGSDFWESGAIRPDIILNDLIGILHGELVPEHQLFYFYQLR